MEAWSSLQALLVYIETFMQTKCWTCRLTGRQDSEYDGQVCQIEGSLIESLGLEFKEAREAVPWQQSHLRTRLDVQHEPELRPVKQIVNPDNLETQIDEMLMSDGQVASSLS